MFEQTFINIADRPQTAGFGFQLEKGSLFLKHNFVVSTDLFRLKSIHIRTIDN